MIPTERDKRFLTLARRIALRSSFFKKQVGVAIVKGNKDLAEGWNRLSHPTYLQFPGIDELRYFSLHAEVDALARANDVRHATAYLFGFKKGRLGYAAPCGLCRRYLKLRGIKRIVYTGIQGKSIHEEKL